ncbi:hypothetical protein EVJ30_11055 [Exiguobacterium sp. SH5S13]|uniref:hypothetical protein n=1 Tax=Exiguobacterium sp. SH5S13 TaxID=2510959 RepID=UPI00103967C9|nr:hypothetical protein [Exiguobacterium sp. SH5S13]TCI51397.1 hypothetical protein EVJ30_11055 [Exiguobacterium sp. SH5S13]
MSATTDNKAMDVLLERFLETSEQSKVLENTIDNFAQVMKDFQETVVSIDETIDMRSLSDLSKDAQAKFQEIKNFNSAEVVLRLENTIEQQLSNHIKQVQKTMQANKKTDMTTLENRIEKILSEGNQANSEELRAQQDNHYANLLQHFNNLNTSSYSSSSTSNSEEVTKLRQLVSSLHTKVRRLEEDMNERMDVLEQSYQVKIDLLENEIRLLQK